MKHLLLFFLFISFGPILKATHLTGAELTYQRLNNLELKITLTLYRDCSSSNINSAWNGLQFESGFISIYDSLEQYKNYISLDFTDFEILEINSGDPCISNISEACVEKGTYEGIFFIADLELETKDMFIYERYTRQTGVANTQGNNSMLLSSTFVDENNNSSPLFNQPIIPVLCYNLERELDFSATDIDGDELRYRIARPFGVLADLNSVNQPIISTPPPLPEIPFINGFNSTFPLGSNSLLEIDEQTGIVTVRPGYSFKFTFSVHVDEYRNGEYLNTTIRDYTYLVRECESLSPEIITLNNDNIIYEDCETSGFAITLPNNTNQNVSIYYSIEGSAVNGEDFQNIADSVIIAPGESSNNIPIYPIIDNISNEYESIIITLNDENECLEQPFPSDTIYIRDIEPLNIYLPQSSIHCEEEVSITPEISGGLAPYHILWNTGSSDTVIIVSPYESTLYTLSVTDECSSTTLSNSTEIIIECPIIAPNIFTPNQDGNNDFLVFQNLEQYEKCELSIYDRWGTLIYNDKTYENNWSGLKNNSGKPISEGTYYYILKIPNHDYIHSFFTLIKD